MRRILKSFLLLGLVIAALFNTLPINAQGAQTSLKGTDIYNGLRGENFNEGWKFNKGDVNGGQNTTYNDSSWASISLPHDWSIFNAFNQGSSSGSGGGYLDGGVGWYRKTFTIPADYNGKKVFIEFDGAYMNSQVWINGTSLGTRPYGYVSFEYDLTPYLVYGGSNVIAVRINNNQPTSRWYSGSGLYRNVWLTVLNPTHVDYCGMFVTTPNVSSSSATVNVKTKILNQSGVSQSVALTTTILDANGNTVTTSTASAVSINAGGNSTFNQNLTVSGPRLWSPASPNLYTVKTQVSAGGSVVDTYQSTSGIRYFNFDANNGFSINGVSTKLNGVCMHHDLGSLGAAVNYRAIERQLQILKAMGCNAIRTSHNPADPQLPEICDRLGIMIMEEAFDCWETAKNNNDYHLYFNSWGQADIKAMVMRDRNHPSIIIWSLGNEIFGATLATATNLRNWVREIDTTRPVTCGSNDTYYGLSTEILNILDLVGYNYNPGIYDARHNSYPNWKIFGSETSSAVRSRGIYKTPTNQNILTGSDNQCSSYDNSVVSWGNSAESSYTAINNRRFIAGEFIWTGFDYIGEPTPYGWPAKSSYFGIVDTCGFPKDIYYFYQSKWTTTPMVHILPHWNWSNGTTVEVWAYSNCDTVELFLNGVSQGVRNVGNSLHLSWNVSWASGTIQAKGTRGGTVVYDQITTAGSASRVQLKPDRTTITADGKDLVFIETNITDANGVIVPNAANTVNFSVSGPGTIVGVDNGNAPSTESYKANSRKAFSGKCLVIVQATKASGSIVVTAGSSGLSSGSVTISSTGGTPTTPTPTPGPQSAFSRIEAENYSSQSGIQTETCSEGGEDVGFIENGDYIAFNSLNFGSGAASFQARVASATSGGNIEIRLDSSTGTLIGTCPVAATGDWQTWTTATCSVSGVNGIHNLYLVFTGDSGYLFNINWLEFVAGSGPTPTPAGAKGDVNGDGSITIVDALMTAQYSVGLAPAGFITANADVNCDGSITIVDALMIAQYYVGLITKFSC